MSDDKYKRDRLFLRDVVEHAKKELTVQRETNVSFQVGDHIYDSPLSRAKFENFCVDLFKDTIDIITRNLEGANIKKEEIDRVVIVGGSTRIPKIRAMLKDYFPQKYFSI